VYLNFSAVEVVKQRIKESPALEALVAKFDQCIHQVTQQTKAAGITCHGAFVKLSTRSPKDAALYDNAKIRALIREEATRLHARTPFTDDDSLDQIAFSNYEIFSRLAWKGLCITTGVEAIELLLESRRTYHDSGWALHYKVPLKISKPSDCSG